MIPKCSASPSRPLRCCLHNAGNRGLVLLARPPPLCSPGREACATVTASSATVVGQPLNGRHSDLCLADEPPGIHGTDRHGRQRGRTGDATSQRKLNLLLADCHALGNWPTFRWLLSSVNLDACQVSFFLSSPLAPASRRCMRSAG